METELKVSGMHIRSATFSDIVGSSGQGGKREWSSACWHDSYAKVFCQVNNITNHLLVISATRGDHRGESSMRYYVPSYT